MFRLPHTDDVPGGFLRPAAVPAAMILWSPSTCSFFWHWCLIAVSVLSSRSKESLRLSWSSDESSASSSSRICPLSDSKSVRLPQYPRGFRDVSGYRVSSSVSECYVQHGVLVAAWLVRGNFSDTAPRAYGTWGNERSATHFKVGAPQLENDGALRYETELPQMDARLSYVMLTVYPCSACNRSVLHCRPASRLPWLPLRATPSDLERLFAERRYLTFLYVVLVQFVKHVALFSFGVQVACCVYLRWIRPWVRGRHRATGRTSREEEAKDD